MQIAILSPCGSVRAARLHTSVLLHEAVDALVSRPNGCYVDATFGRGGHTREILLRLAAGARVLAIDRDPQALEAGRRDFAGEPRLQFVHAAFSSLTDLLEEHGLFGQLDGILLDLGVSSPQLDDPARGFSFQHDGPLDMRMNPADGSGAAQWLASAAENEIAAVLRDFGEERHARRMARAIVAERQIEPIDTTARLADIVARANPAWERDKHPATRAFQAIRIFINKELQELDEVLEQSIDALASGGRLVVISFHSLEDRRVKRFIRSWSTELRTPRRLPPPSDAQSRVRLRRMGQPIRAKADEKEANPRARSAIMRVAEKLQ